LSKRGVEVSRKADLPELTKLLARELKLVPEGVSEEAKGAETIRLILRNLSALTQYLAELRGLYGSGHGRDGRHRGLGQRMKVIRGPRPISSHLTVFAACLPHERFGPARIEFAGSFRIFVCVLQKIFWHVDVLLEFSREIRAEKVMEILEHRLATTVFIYVSYDRVSGRRQRMD
jgi:hypothetical protein